MRCLSGELRSPLKSRKASFVAIPGQPILLVCLNAEWLIYWSTRPRKVAQSFGAVKNPESFLLIPAEGGFKIVYKGNIDDNALMADKVSQRFLENAIEMIITGKDPAKASTDCFGCAIREL